MRFALHARPNSLNATSLFVEVDGDWSQSGRHFITRISDEGKTVFMVESTIVPYDVSTALENMKTNQIADYPGTFDDIPRTLAVVPFLVKSVTALFNTEDDIIFTETLRKLDETQGIENLNFDEEIDTVIERYDENYVTNRFNRRIDKYDREASNILNTLMTRDPALVIMLVEKLDEASDLIQEETEKLLSHIAKKTVTQTRSIQH